jgi:predicted MFS family arabinose efflux permease
VAAGRRDPFLIGALALAVALAAADSSVVVLALPAIYGTFDVSLVGVSWTITSYNIAIVVGALVVLGLERRVRGHLFAGYGLAIFAACSLVCGLATSFPMLIAGRSLQGIGAGLALAGALPVLAGIRASDEHALKVWAAAGTLGAALGPALGGVLTQLFSWRSIFLVQAPLAALALLAMLDHRARQTEITNPSDPTRPRLLANVGILLLYAALVGALFLAVLLLVVVWGASPIAGAAVVSALPVGAVAVDRMRPHVPIRFAVAMGGVCLAGGLVALAFLPAATPGWAAAALGACGLGLGLLGGVLGAAAVPHDRPGIRAATTSVAARHAGFVLGLIVIAPILAANVTAGTKDAMRASTAVVLESPISLRNKISVALDMRDLVEKSPRGEVPNVREPFDRLGAKTDANLRASREDVVHAIRDTITRTFRLAFLIAALFGAAAAFVALFLPAAQGVRHSADLIALGAGVMALVCLLVVLEFRAGASDFGKRTYVDPCNAPTDPYPQGRGIDGTLQRISLSAIDGAACKLGVSREELVLSLDSRGPFGDKVHWTQATLEDALRAGLVQAISDADDRNTIPGFVATGLKFLAERAPIDWVLGRIDIPFLES